MLVAVTDREVVVVDNSDQACDIGTCVIVTVRCAGASMIFATTDSAACNGGVDAVGGVLVIARRVSMIAVSSSSSVVGCTKSGCLKSIEGSIGDRDVVRRSGRVFTEDGSFEFGTCKL